MRITKILMLFIISIFCVGLSSSFATGTDISYSGNIAEQRINSFEKLSETDISKQINETESNIIDKKANDEALKIKIDNLNSEIDGLTSNLNQNQIKIRQLEEENKNLQDGLKNSGDKLSGNISEITKLTKKNKDLEEQLRVHKDTIIELNQAKNENETILKNYAQIKSELEEKVLDERNSKFSILLGFISLMFVTWLAYGLYVQNHKKLTDEIKERKTKVMNILFPFFTLNSIIVGFFYLHSEYAIYILFFGGALSIIFKDFILSFFLSIIIVGKYQIGDILEIKKKDIRGKIKNVSLLNIELFGLDEKNNYTNDRIRIPNSLLFSEIISSSGKTSIINDKITFQAKEFITYQKVKNLIENILEKNVQYTLKNFDEHNSKFKSRIAIKENGTFITYVWNDTIDSNLKIKEKLVKVLLENGIIGGTNDLEKGKEDENQDNGLPLE